MSRGFYQHQSSPNSKRIGNMEVNTAGRFQSPALLQTSPIDPTGLSPTRVGKMTMHAPALVQQLTHLVHSNRFHRPSYLLRKIACIREEKYNRKQTNTREKNKQTVHAIIHPLFRKVMISLLTNPGQTACFARLTMRSSLAAAVSSLVSRIPRERRLVV